mmetsp:Transcript_540/g.943  ORF Transcript_540/g.943 Transcript_540/m.943 type:complete len:223 (-) Transcript_540:1148-1816(-)
MVKFCPFGIDKLQATSHHSFSCSRVCMNVPPNPIESDIVFHRKRDFVDDFSRACGNDCGSDNGSSAFQAENFAKPNVVAFQNGPIIVFQSGTVYIHLNTSLGCHIFARQSHCRILGFRVHDSWNHKTANLPIILEKSILHHHFGHFSTHVSETGNSRRTISNCIHIGVSKSACIIINQHALLFIIFHSCSFKTQIANIGQPPSCHKETFTFKVLLCPILERY